MGLVCVDKVPHPTAGLICTNNGFLMMLESTMENIATSYFTDGDVTIRYCKRGLTGPVVVLIHGMGCSSLEWSENIDYLSHEMTVVAVDLVGFGESSKPADFDYSAKGQAAQLIRLLDALGANQFHLVGNSFGGRVAIEMVDAAPERVLSLMLVDSAGGGKDVPLPMRLNTLPCVRRLRRKPSFTEFMQGWQFAFHDPTKLTEARVRRKFEDSLNPSALRVEIRVLRSMINLFGFKASELSGVQAKLRKIKCRTLIVWGRQDRLLPVEHAFVLNKLVENSRVKIFEECGHAPQVECASLFNAMALHFFNSEVVE